MKHIHFVIYRLKSIIIIYCCYFIYLLIHFFIICIYSEIDLIKPFGDVKIQRTTIKFTKGGCDRTVFFNKMINSEIMRMFIFFYNFYIYMFYFVSQVLCICIANYDYFSMKNMIFLLQLFYFILI
jgi:hypothetical protein